MKKYFFTIIAIMISVSCHLIPAQANLTKLPPAGSGGKTGGGPGAGPGGINPNGVPPGGLMQRSLPVGSSAKTKGLQQAPKTASQAITENQLRFSCGPAMQTVRIGQIVYMTITGGTPPFRWQAPRANPATGEGSSFAVQYDRAGMYNVVSVIDSDGKKTKCVVNVSRNTNIQSSNQNFENIPSLADVAASATGFLVQGLIKILAL